MRVCKCGCGAEVQGKSTYATECRLERRKVQLREHHKKCKAQMLSDLAEVQAVKEISKPKPRREHRPILSDAEQRRHDIELEQRLALKCGYGNGVCKSLPPEEIAKLARQYQPPERSESVGYFDKFFSGESATVFN